MNTERIQNIIDLLRSGKKNFHMESLLVESDPECGSAGCIAGHAAFLWPHLTSYPDLWGDPTLPNTWVQSKVTAWLELAEETADQLFFVTDLDRCDLAAITRHDAIEVLEVLLERGYVDWYTVLVKNHGEVPIHR